MIDTPCFRLVSLLFIVLSVQTLAGCSRNKCVIGIDDAYSVNVVKPPACFPEEIETLTAAQQEVYARYGRPDYIRYWWNPDGEFVNSSDLISMVAKIEDHMTTQRKSWIYYYDDMEIVFKPQDTGYDPPVKLGELTKTVCRYGDPSQRTEKMMINGAIRENWMYIDHGFTLELADGAVVKTVYHKATGTGTYPGK
jgi:hypothetical protein